MWIADTMSYGCSICNEGYRFDVPFYNCTSCQSGCKNCNETSCIICKDGYTLKADKTCQSVTHFWKYALIGGIVAVVSWLGWYVYKNYIMTPKNGQADIPDYEATAYKREEPVKKTGENTTPFKGGRRANPDTN